MVFASLQDIKNGVSNSYFVKIKTFRLTTRKLLGSRRKTYILDVVCNRFYFGENSGRSSRPVQCAGYLTTQKRRSICLSAVCSRKKKQAGWLRKCLCKYSTEVSRFVLEILVKSKFIASVIP